MFIYPDVPSFSSLGFTFFECCPSQWLFESRFFIKPLCMGPLVLDREPAKTGPLSLMVWPPEPLGFNFTTISDCLPSGSNSSFLAYRITGRNWNLTVDIDDKYPLGNQCEHCLY